jgi:hypothetical protein
MRSTILVAVCLAAVGCGGGKGSFGSGGTSFKTSTVSATATADACTYSFDVEGPAGTELRIDEFTIAFEHRAGTQPRVVKAIAPHMTDWELLVDEADSGRMKWESNVEGTSPLTGRHDPTGEWRVEIRTDDDEERTDCGSWMSTPSLTLRLTYK